ncbi:hypothetical protein [Hymenobacter sp. UV11]|uniref:hypothetical protein n=1 Tax=Hymenobacter sp. UV11 TaxID=1849735 RepID=UPI001414EA79|nr:hypothetical protein [Hymenobacter sp. UV11]
MVKKLIRHILPLAVLGALTLSSCVVHEHDRGGRGHDRGYRDHGRGHGRGY